MLTVSIESSLALNFFTCLSRCYALAYDGLAPSVQASSWPVTISSSFDDKTRILHVCVFLSTVQFSRIGPSFSRRLLHISKSLPRCQHLFLSFFGPFFQPFSPTREGVLFGALKIFAWPSAFVSGFGLFRCFLEVCPFLGGRILILPPFFSFCNYFFRFF